MANMKLNRSYTLRTTRGHVIEFKKDKIVNVPRSIHEDALAVGAVFAEEKEQDKHVTRVEAAANAKTKPEMDEYTRQKLMMDKIKEMVANNNRSDFSAAGKPNAKKMSSALGFDISSNERDTVWDKFLEEGRAAEEAEAEQAAELAAAEEKVGVEVNAS